MPAFFPHKSALSRLAFDATCLFLFLFPSLRSAFLYFFSHFVVKDFLILFFLRYYKTPHLCCGAALIEVSGPHLLHQQLLHDEASTPPLESPLGFLLQTLSVLVSRVALCLSSVDACGFCRVQRRTLCSDESAEKWIKPAAGGKKTDTLLKHFLLWFSDMQQKKNQKKKKSFILSTNFTTLWRETYMHIQIERWWTGPADSNPISVCSYKPLSSKK